ncbi:hypothetical protein [Nocardia aurea]|jgi:hypothetical protein|uniref:hypothetical protein n=1 Tax=Nocardia aurea TaxID=2144174 RepID=UPI0033A451F0
MRIEFTEEQRAELAAHGEALRRMVESIRPAIEAAGLQLGETARQIGEAGRKAMEAAALEGRFVIPPVRLTLGKTGSSD